MNSLQTNDFDFARIQDTSAQVISGLFSDATTPLEIVRFMIRFIVTAIVTARVAVKFQRRCLSKPFYTGSKK